MLISVGYSLPRSHFALVGFFVLLHDGVDIAISRSATSITGSPIGIEVSIWKTQTIDMVINGLPIPLLYIAYGLGTT